MRFAAPLSACLLAAVAARADVAPPPPRATLTVEVTNFRSDNGKLILAVYRTKADYLKNAAASGSAKIAGGKATVVLEGLEPGEVCVSVFHDEDGDGKMKTNWIGMPKEGTGISNGAKGFMGPPKFDDAKFALPAGAKSISIKLVYL